MMTWLPAAVSSRISGLVTKPLRNGKAEIDAAPTMHRAAVHGMDL